MARKIRFRQQRLYEFKIIIVFVLFTAVIFFGLLAIDLNKNYVIYGEPRIELLQIKKLDSDVYEVNILNSNITLNLKYIKRDINNLKNLIKN